MWIFGYGSLVWKVDFPYIKKVVGYVKGYERKFWQASIDHRGVPEKPGRVVTLVPSANPDARVWGTAYKIHSSDIDKVVEHLDLREVMGYERVPVEFHPISSHPLNIFNIKQSEGSGSGSSGYSTEGSLSSNDEKKNAHVTVYRNQSNTSLSSSDSGNKSESDTEYETEFASEDDEFELHCHDLKIGRPFRTIMYFGSSENEHYVGPESNTKLAQLIYECVGFSGKNIDYLLNLCDAMREICDEALDSHLQELESLVISLRNEEQEMRNSLELERRKSASGSGAQKPNPPNNQYRTGAMKL